MTQTNRAVVYFRIISLLVVGSWSVRISESICIQIWPAGLWSPHRHNKYCTICVGRWAEWRRHLSHYYYIGSSLKLTFRVVIAQLDGNWNEIVYGNHRMCIVNLLTSLLKTLLASTFGIRWCNRNRKLFERKKYDFCLAVQLIGRIERVSGTGRMGRNAQNGNIENPMFLIRSNYRWIFKFN